MAVSERIIDSFGKIVTLTTPVDKMPSEGGITLGERLHEIEDKLDHALDTRADKTEVEELKRKVTTIEFTLARYPEADNLKRLATFEGVINDVRDLKRDSVTKAETRRWHVGIILAIFLAILPIVLALMISHIKFVP